MKSGVIFDKDGTLDKRPYAGPDILSGYFSGFYEQSKHILRKPLNKLAGDHNVTGGPFTKIKATAAKLTLAYEGALECLHDLSREGYKLAMVTTASTPTVRGSLDKTGIGAFLKTVITSNDVRNIKPNPESLKVASKRMGVDVDRLVYVGNAKADARAAKALGMDFIIAKWGAGNLKDTVKVNNDPVACNFNELYRIIKNM